jgi:olfactory receptor
MSLTPFHVNVFSLALVDNTTTNHIIHVESQLHISMYFLISQLSLMDLMYIFTAVPKMALNFLSEQKASPPWSMEYRSSL